VTKDVEPYSIVGGNPVREIRKRFSEKEIKKLLEIRWWDWPIEKITANVQKLTGNKIDTL
jgi:virginiamycin A acetyltransferase